MFGAEQQALLSDHERTDLDPLHGDVERNGPPGYVGRRGAEIERTIPGRVLAAELKPNGAGLVFLDGIKELDVKLKRAFRRNHPVAFGDFERQPCGDDLGTTPEWPVPAVGDRQGRG